MNRRRTKAILVAGLIILVLIGAYLALLISQPARPLSVVVAFVGYTNDLNGQRVAAFTIHNHSPVPIRRWDRYQIEDAGKAVPGPLVFRGQNVVLDPGQSEALTIPVPTNKTSWRVVLSCSAYGMRQDIADWANRTGYWRYLPESFRGLPGQYVRSDWIDK